MLKRFNQILVFVDAFVLHLKNIRFCCDHCHRLCASGEPNGNSTAAALEFESTASALKGFLYVVFQIFSFVGSGLAVVRLSRQSSKRQ